MSLEWGVECFLETLRGKKKQGHKWEELEGCWELYYLPMMPKTR